MEYRGGQAIEILTLLVAQNRHGWRGGAEKKKLTIVILNLFQDLGYRQKVDSETSSQ